MTDNQDGTLVFVYGTLLRGESNHGLLSRARFLGDGVTTPDYRLLDMGGFPALVQPGECAVHGEVYAVDDCSLALLDELEDHPSYYRRTTIRLADGREVQSYLLPAPLAFGNATIESGDWRDPSRQKIA